MIAHQLPVEPRHEIGGIKIDRFKVAVVTATPPINVPCTIFNEIPSIRDWWSENNGHWLIRTQAWAATD